MPRRAKIVRGTTTITTTLPQLQWQPVHEPVGSYDKSAAGVPDSFIVRFDELLMLRLRVLQAEYSAVHALIRAAQADPGTPLLFYPHAEEPTSYTCYLESPQAGARWQPSWDTEGRYWIFDLTLRRTTDDLMAPVYHA